MAFKIDDIEKESDQNPHSAGVTLVARGLGELLNELGGSQSAAINLEYVSYAANLWRQARRVLLWWTSRAPGARRSRVQHQSLRKIEAAHHGSPSGGPRREGGSF